MNRRLLLIAFTIAAQAHLAAAAGQKGVSIPTTVTPAAAPAASIPALPSAAVLPAASLALPNVAAAIPQAAAPQAAAANLSKISESMAPQLQAAAAPKSGADASAGAGQSIQTILQGGQAAPAAGAVSAMSPAGSGIAASGSGLTPAAPSAPSNKGGGDGPSAPKAPSVKPVDSRASYAFRRFGLSLVAKLTGAVYSLPQGGAKLTASILKETAFKDAVLSDIDDTLGKYNTILEPEVVAGIVGVNEQGKTFAAITDRPDFARAGSSQLGAMDTFSSVPVEKRQGLIVATNGGGKIYQYDAQGEPKLIYEEPNLPESEREIVKASAEVVKPQLEGLGSGLQTQDPKDASKPMTPENHGPYGYSMILKAGTPEATVKRIAHLMEEAMKERGLSYEVEGRMAKDPTLPPYITFSKLNKSLAVRRIAELKKLEADRTILIGDSMYAPKAALKASPRLEKWAESLSGRPLPLTGNATDRNMELGLPGALTLSVGGTADPRMANAYVLEGKGAEATRRVLSAVASTPKGAESRRETAGRFAVLALVIAMGVMSFYGIYTALTGLTEAPAPQQEYDQLPPNFDMNDLFR